MTRVLAYVDGFNLYFGLRDAGLKRLYWLDVAALAARLCKPDQRLVHTRYFTARIRGDGAQAEDAQRQVSYLDALSTREDLTIVEGHFLAKPAKCRACGTAWSQHEEKMTDVNIAVALLTDAFDDRFDTALVMSADSDLVPPLRTIRARFPHKRVIVAFPPARASGDLRNVAHAAFTIGTANLRHAQLPDTVVTPHGVPLHRPPSWR
jgi:uncharacterized LabA/DUF88 family protein